MGQFIENQISSFIVNVTSKILNFNFERAWLHNFQKQFVIRPLDKAGNNFSFICETFYIFKILNKSGLSLFPAIDDKMYAVISI